MCIFRCKLSKAEAEFKLKKKAGVLGRPSHASLRGKHNTIAGDLKQIQQTFKLTTCITCSPHLESNRKLYYCRFVYRFDGLMWVINVFAHLFKSKGQTEPSQVKN